MTLQAAGLRPEKSPGQRIGFLDILMPTDLIAMATVGAYIARQGEPLVARSRLRRPHHSDRGAAAHRGPRDGTAGREHAPEAQGLDERELLDVNEAVLFFLAMATF